MPNPPHIVEDVVDEDDEIWNMLLSTKKPSDDSVPKQTDDSVLNNSDDVIIQPLHGSCVKIHQEILVHTLPDSVKNTMDPPLGCSLSELGKMVINGDKIPRGMDLIKRILVILNKESISIEYRHGESSFGAFSAFLQDGRLKIKCLECGSEIKSVLKDMEAHVRSGDPTKKQTDHMFFRLDEETSVSLTDIFNCAKTTRGDKPSKKRKTSEEDNNKKNKKPKTTESSSSFGKDILYFCSHLVRLGGVFDNMEKCIEILNKCDDLSKNQGEDKAYGFVKDVLEKYDFENDTVNIVDEIYANVCL
jgi:hypothetical protein